MDEKGAIISSFLLSASLSAAGEAFEKKQAYAELTFARARTEEAFVPARW